MRGKVGIVLVNYNGEKYITDCINSLLNQTYGNLVILFWDNASEDCSVEIVQDRYPQIHLIQSKANYGFAKANNVAVEKMFQMEEDIEYILLLNVDTVADPFLVEELLQKADGNTVTTAYICMGSHGQSIWYAGGEIQVDTGKAVHLYTRNRSEEMQVTFISGCCMMIHRDIIHQYGLFDPAYYMYYEDVDLCMRWGLCGVKMYYIPSAKLWHKVGGSIGGVKNPVKAYYMARNRLYFARKYAGHIKMGCMRIIFEILKNGLLDGCSHEVAGAYRCGVMDFCCGRMGQMVQLGKRNKIVYLPYTVSSDKVNEYSVNMIKILQEKYLVAASLAEPMDIVQMLHTKAVFLNWMEQALDRKMKLQLILYKIWGAHVIWVFHNKYPHDMEQSVELKKNMEWMANHSSKIMLHSKSSVHYIPNGVRNSKKAVFVPHILYEARKANNNMQAVREHYGIDEGKFVFTVFGAVRPYKNIEGAIAAFQKLCLKDSVLLIAGNPTGRSYAQKITELCKDNKNIILDLKYISNASLDGIIDMSDVVIMPYKDGSSMNSGVMIHAFSKGKTVVTPNICMARDMAAEKFMYIYRTSLGKAMRKAYRNGKEINRKMGARAREYINKNNNRDAVKKCLYGMLQK